MRQWFAIKTLLIALAALALAGCGGGSSSANKTVAQVTLGPATLSMVAGEIVAVTTTTSNPTGGAVSPAPNVTINTSNPKLVTVSPGQQVCAGVWDSTFVVCNGLDAGGNPLSGTATLTATANGVSSAPASVSVHPPVSAIVVDPVTGCTSNKQTQQFTAHACSAAVTPHAATGPCAPNAAEISDKIGGFTWASTNGVVVTIDPNGLATANAPGLAGILANVGTTSSPATNFKTCMPTQIVLHITGDPPGQPTESANINLTDTKIIQADMVDEKGLVVLGAPVALFSSDSEIVSVIGTATSATITGQSPGGAGILASCVPPVCGAGINQPVYSNIFTVFVNGTSPATFLYVGSSASTTLLPFDTSKSPPAPGTAITLPGGTRSIVFTPDGAKAYVATTGGLVSVDTTTNVPTTLTTNAVGSILAISPDGNRLVMTNAPFEPDPTHHRLFVFDATVGTLTTFILPGAVGASFARDGSKAYIAAGTNVQNIYVYSPFITLTKLTVGGNALTTAATASGPFTFVANTTGLQVINNCDNSLATSAPVTSTPQRVGAYLDEDIIVTVNQTGLDFDSLTIGLPPSGFCPTTVTHNNHFLDFGIGAFTARQLIVSPSVKGHVVVLPVGINKVLGAVAAVGIEPVVLSSGATEALSGGITLDGNTVWVGVAGSNTLDRINMVTGADDLQIQLTGLKKGDGTQAAPDAVGVRPK
jgi:hypothetical protein